MTRLGVYQDGPFRLLEGLNGARVAADPADAPFFRFVDEVGRHFETFAIFARVVPGPPGRGSLPLEAEVVALPDYGSLRRVHSVVASAFATWSSFWRGLSEVDVIWAFGPHPFEVGLVLIARLRRRRVVLGVRQDTREYYRARLPSSRWKPILGAVTAMEGLHRLLARGVPATVVGTANARRYAKGNGRVLMMMPSLVRDADVLREPRERDWSGVVDLLSVGRIDAEKNPLLLVDALAELEVRRPGRYRLRWAGTGPMVDAVRARAADRGIADRLELLGYVPFGSELLEHYRRSHAFVHVSLTEGVPHVLVEALSSGTPIVATDVGGVRDALEGGEAGLLVPAKDGAALVEAILRLTDDAPLRSTLVARGLELARERTLEKEAARVAAFLEGSPTL